MPLNVVEGFATFADLPLRADHLSEYSDVWLIEPTRGAALLSSLRGVLSNWPTHYAQWQTKHDERMASGRGGPVYTTTADGIAVIELVGTLMKQQQSGGLSTSTILTRRALRLAARDPDVKSILLVIDSPGGTAAGTADLADDIAAADKIKPVDAYIQDCGCSAAYWAAAMCRTIAANRTSANGSISTYTVVEDLSGAAAKEQIKVHVVKPDDAWFKGAGVPGTEVTQEQLAEIKKRVVAVNEQFLADVAKGRKWSAEKVKQLADGRVFTGEEARALGLVDRVESLDETLMVITKRLQPNPQSRGTKAMSTAADKTTERVAATLADLQSHCPGASSDFIVAQLGKQATVAEAMTAMILASNEATKKAEERATAAEEKAKGAEAKGGAAPVTRPGHTVPTEGTKSKSENTKTGDDPVATWKELVRTDMAENKCEKREAVARVARQNPQLHADYLNAFNKDHDRPATFKAGKE